MVFHGSQTGIFDTLNITVCLHKKTNQEEIQQRVGFRAKTMTSPLGELW